MMTRSFLIALLVAGTTACGGGDAPPAATPAPAAVAPEAEEAAPTPEQRRGVVRGQTTGDEEGDGAPVFHRVGIEPGDAMVGDDLKAIAELVPGHSRFTEVQFTWFVNNQSVLGWTRDHLPASRGDFKKGDRVRVRAEARDEKAREGTMESNDLVVQNSPPTIVTDLRTASRMDGVRLIAEDPDVDDKLVWSLKDGPPGVSIDRKGRIAVRQVRLDKQWNGEVVFAVEDPAGATAEIHIPVAVNAATDDSVETKKETRRVTMEKMDQGKLDDAALRDAERVGEMSEEEFKKYMDAREARGGPESQ